MSQFTVMTPEEIKEVADSHNCDVVVAQPNELQFDLDSEEAYGNFNAFYHLRLVPKFGDDIAVHCWKSKSGNNHFVVTLPENFDVVERIAMQSQGGSDPGREFAALFCHKAGSETPVLLFRPKDAEVKRWNSPAELGDMEI